MGCKECDNYQQLNICLNCGEILKPYSQNIQQHYKDLDKIVNKDQNES